MDGTFALCEVREQRPVEELRTVVTVKSPNPKRQHLFNAGDGMQDTLLAFAPSGPLFCPACGNINHIDGIGEDSRCGGAAMGNRISLKKPRDVVIPLIGVDGDLFLEQGTGLGGGKSSLAVARTNGCQETINCCR